MSIQSGFVVSEDMYVCVCIFFRKINICLMLNRPIYQHRLNAD